MRVGPKTPKIISSREAYDRLADACVRAEYCSGELREKLRRWRIDSGEAARIVERLSAERFVDDARFARAFVRQKSVLARWGRRKIACALAAKRVDRDIIAEALGEIDPAGYAEGLLALLAAKARSLGPEALATYEGRTRLYRYAASRGYETEAISQAIRKLITP